MCGVWSKAYRQAHRKRRTGRRTGSGLQASAPEAAAGGTRLIPLPIFFFKKSRLTPPPPPPRDLFATFPDPYPGGSYFPGGPLSFQFVPAPLPRVSGQNPTGQKPIGQYPSGQNPRRTKTQGDKIPWGQKPRGTISK